ncbi:MAG: hypothetical protein IK117_00980 [Bacteroidales bacterium]|nr:hypothetical protein [Bacteroidales bacterium]
MKALLKKIVERWFLTEPALFHVYCMQHLRENLQMPCPMRCGKGMVEYNPTVLLQMNCSEDYVENLLRLEMIRLLLKHPYERQPECSLPAALTLGSNMVIDQHYLFQHLEFVKASDYQLPKNQCFEWYVNKLNVLLQEPPSEEEDAGKEESDEEDESDEEVTTDNDNEDSSPSDNDGDDTALEEEKQDIEAYSNDEQETIQDELPTIGDEIQAQLSAQSELWEEDELKKEEINNLIRETTQWGSLPGKLVEQIIASLVVKLDYRKVLNSFHTSILSSKRRLTRMRPNRRSGFQQMGSIYELASSILVAVDVSGSISHKTLQAFYSTIARFFKYGVETIDVVQFDVGLREVTTFKKRPTKVDVNGRGGTEFQSVFNYIKEHRKYDGLIVFTDGYAPEPQIDFKMRTKVLWVCRSEQEYKEHAEWMKRTGKVCWIEF